MLWKSSSGFSLRAAFRRWYAAALLRPPELLLVGSPLLPSIFWKMPSNPLLFFFSLAKLLTSFVSWTTAFSMAWLGHWSLASPCSSKIGSPSSSSSGSESTLTRFFGPSRLLWEATWSSKPQAGPAVLREFRQVEPKPTHQDPDLHTLEARRLCLLVESFEILQASAQVCSAGPLAAVWSKKTSFRELQADLLQGRPPSSREEFPYGFLQGKNWIARSPPLPKTPLWEDRHDLNHLQNPKHLRLRTSPIAAVQL